MVWHRVMTTATRGSQAPRWEQILDVLQGFL